MSAKSRLVFDLAPEEKEWLGKLQQSAGYPSKVAMLRDLADKLAAEIQFEPRPGVDKTK